TDNAGLDVVRYVRTELGNQQIRIVLRTGQPGQAPEDDVVANYDINDYKDKTELTSQKLRTLIRASLRSYRDICSLEHNRKGLEKV
ncbi:MAG: phosphodiesterase, partial [Aeromonadaceae bacterium]